MTNVLRLSVALACALLAAPLLAEGLAELEN
jgi:hypothetical protein